MQAEVAVLLRSGRDGVTRDVHLAIVGEQILGGLVHADVCLDPAEQDLVALAVVQSRVEAIGLERAEAELFDRRDALQVRGDLRHRRAQALRILLGDQHGQSQGPRGLHQHGNVVRHPLEVEHHRPKCLLHVDHGKRRSSSIELHAPLRGAVSRVAVTESSASLIENPRSR